MDRPATAVLAHLAHFGTQPVSCFICCLQLTLNRLPLCMVPLHMLLQITKLKEEQKEWSDKVQAYERKTNAIEEENRRLKEENERLRDELKFLRTEVSAAGSTAFTPAAACKLPGFSQDVPTSSHLSAHCTTTTCPVLLPYMQHT